MLWVACITYTDELKVIISINSGGNENTYKILAGKPEETDHLEDLSVDGIIIKCILEK
jgi:hypothetical protein